MTRWASVLRVGHPMILVKIFDYSRKTGPMDMKHVKQVELFPGLDSHPDQGPASL